MTVGGFYSRGNRSVKRYFLRLRDFTKIRKYPKRPKEWTRIKGCFRTCRVLMTPTITGKPPSTPAGMHILCHFFAVGRQLFLIEGEDRSEVEQMKRRFYGRGVFTRIPLAVAFGNECFLRQKNNTTQQLLFIWGLGDFPWARRALKCGTGGFCCLDVSIRFSAQNHHGTGVTPKIFSSIQRNDDGLACVRQIHTICF